MRKFVFATMVLSAIMLAACSNNSRTLEGSWLIDSAYGTPVTIADTAFITFEEGMVKVHGCNGCNRFFGPCTVENSTISLKNLATTMMVCPDAPSEAEIMKAFAEAETYSVKESNGIDKLYLYNGDKKEVLSLTYTPETK